MNQLHDLIKQIEDTLNAQWVSTQEHDLCNGCKYFELSWSLLTKALLYLKKTEKGGDVE